MTKKPLPTPRSTQAEADRLKAAIAPHQSQAKHRAPKTGRYKVPLYPDGKTPAPAEEGGINRDDLA